MIHCSDGQLTCPPPETVGMSRISGTFTGAGVWLLLSNWLVPGGLTIMGGVLLAGGDGVLSGLLGGGGEGDFRFLAFFFGSMNFFFNLGFLHLGLSLCVSESSFDEEYSTGLDIFFFVLHFFFFLLGSDKEL